MFQFPTSIGSAITTERPSFTDLNTKESILDLSILDKYKNVFDNAISVMNAFYLIQKVNVPESLLVQMKTCFTEEKKTEFEWLVAARIKGNIDDTQWWALGT